MNLGFIGAGRMAEAIISGLTSRRAVAKKNILISDKDTARVKLVSRKYKLKAAEGNSHVGRSADVIILAVKPQVMAQVLGEICGDVRPGQLVISIAAGITLKSIEKYLPRVAVIRVMPNNPCLIGEGISLITGGRFAQEKDLKMAEKIFSSVGDVSRIDEKYMNAVTGLSGSGPAFVYEMLEALTNGGIEAGLSRETAKKLAERTMLGAVCTVIRTGRTPEELKAMVTSPGGTTLAGLRVMDENGVKQALRKAVVRAAQRAKEISEEFERSL